MFIGPRGTCLNLKTPTLSDKTLLMGVASLINRTSRSLNNSFVLLCRT